MIHATTSFTLDVNADGLPAVEETTAARVSALVLGDGRWQCLQSARVQGHRLLPREQKTPALAGVSLRLRG